MDSIGKYQILEKIGTGGFGAVYKAYDPFIKRHVAIKTCSSDDADIRERFFQEAEIAGNLHHRNITTVYDFGIHDGLPYLIQEHLSGEDLDAKIKRGDYLPFPEKLHVLLQIARGLAHAHEHGVIHRDIKPANVRVLDDGTAKIMDFGIAKLAQRESGLTQTGMTLGTAAYLAPEQIRGESVDPRTDVFSFGALAYELVTYDRPFSGEQISAVLFQILNHRPRPVAELRPNCPPEMVAIIERCLDKDPARRYADAGELLQSLEELQKKLRIERATGEFPVLPGAGADEVTQPLPQSAEVGEPPRGATAEETPEGGIDELELSGTHVGAGLPKVQIAGYGRRRSSRAGIVLAFVLLLAAGVGALWWFERQGWEPPAWLPTPWETGPGETAAVEAEPAPLETPPPGPAAEPPDTAEILAEPAEAPEETAPVETEIAPPPPPPPPPPAPAALVVPAVGWTDGLTVRVGRGRAYSLDRERNFPELEPGSYTLVFRLELFAYLAERNVRLELGPGERRTVENPIPPPALLSIRARPRRPQGEVVIDGESVGPSPIGKRLVEPGTRTIEIRPAGGGEADAQPPPIVETLALPPGQEVILSFDLEASADRFTLRTKDVDFFSASSENPP